MTSLPLPDDPRHQRLADLVCRGAKAADAYRALYPRAKKSTAGTAAAKVLRRPDVAAYLTAIRQAAAAETALSLAEIKSFCARVVRTPITKLDPDSDLDADLIKSYSVNEGEMGSSRRMEKHDPFKAIDIHLKITGEDSGTNALRDLAAAVASLGSASPIPDDQL